MMIRFLRCVVCFLCASLFSGEENFILLNGLTNEVVLELGPHVDEAVTPACSFNIALSLMGYDTGILIDEKTPVWDYQEGYDDFLEAWKAPQTPQSWMKLSCFWYSKLLATQLGLNTMHHYLALFAYGNQDMSGGLTKAWVSSSLRVSPNGVANFIQRMLSGKLPVSNHAIQMTKQILFIEELPGGWKLFGKTGLGTIQDENVQVGWFSGWIEKDHAFFPFAYHIREKKVNLSQRIPRVKQLLSESSVSL